MVVSLGGSCLTEWRDERRRSHCWKHSSHSIGNPLHVRSARCIKGELWLQKRTSEQAPPPVNSLPGLLYDRDSLSFFLCRDIASTSEDVETIFHRDALHFTGEAPSPDVLGRPFLEANIWTRICFYLRCQPGARRTAGVPPAPRGVQQESVSRWMAADAAEFARGSSLKTATRHCRVIAQRAWSATSEVDPAPLRASVEVSCCLPLTSIMLFTHFVCLLVTFQTSQAPLFL